MAWITSFLLHTGELREAPFPFRNASPPPEKVPEGLTRSLLIFVEGRELYGSPQAYTALRAWPIWLETPTGQVWVDFGDAVTDLTDQERVLLRTWLIERSTTAWATADPSIHNLLRDAGPPEK